MKNLFCLLLASYFFINCSLLHTKSKQNPIIEALKSDNPKIKKVVDKSNEHEIQLIFTQIERKANGKISFKDYSYNLESKKYFYPASTVKFPIALLALEKLNTFTSLSDSLNFKLEGNNEIKNFKKEVVKIFALSDNEASNNLLEFIGFDFLNDKMQEKGLSPFRIQHRLAIENASNPITLPISIMYNDSLVLKLASNTNRNALPLTLKNIRKGKGYLQNDSLIKAPFDFSRKNYYSLQTLHNTMKRLVFPEAYKMKERFQITEKDRQFVLNAMSKLPREQGFDEKEYYDSYCKFLVFGDTKERISGSIKIYNKIGQAYGTLTDCAYIIDEENRKEYLISVTILVNQNQIFNDGIYEYEDIGLPFLAELGRQLIGITRSN